MPRIVIESARNGMTARVAIIDVSAADGIVLPACSGDGIDECPDAGFDPAQNDTFGDVREAIAAAEVHMLAHERRVCARCGSRQEWAGTGRDGNGEFVGRYVCSLCDQVEVIR